MNVNNKYIRFTPSRVLGVDNVNEVAIRPDKLELFFKNHDWTYIPFETIAHYPKPARFWKTVRHMGWRPKWLPVGEMNWFHAPRNRFFTFFTQPQITIFMPDDAIDNDVTYFPTIQYILFVGGYAVWDMG